jgi:hypothetical protein
VRAVGSPATAINFLDNVGLRQKIQIALRLRKETTMTLSWIAEHLNMATRTHLSHLLYWYGKDKKTT